MGQSTSLTLVRAASIAAAGMLLFAIFAPVRAENLDGYGIKPVAGGEISNYGRVPVPEPVPGVGGYNPAAAANNSYNAAPVSGGYYPPQPVGGYAAAPPQGAPMSDGYTPASGGFNAGPPQPQYAAAPYAPQPSAPYGYRPSPAAPAYQPQPVYQQPVYQQPAYQPPPAYQPQVAATTGYGYKPGQGMEAPAQTQPQDSAYAYYQTAAYQPNVPRENPDYVLGSGDKLRLTVFEEADLSGDYTVDGSGYLRLPLVGKVRAAGLTSQQLEAAIGSTLARGYLRQPRVSVQVSTYRPFYIIGAVTKPGEYPYVNHMNALNAIALAGGFTPSAVESTIYLRREGSNKEVKMPTDRSTRINPGDVVRVDNTFFWDAMNLFGPLTGPLGIAAGAFVVR
jgi:protein involved in polysaccharide export with SLBB domain